MSGGMNSLFLANPQQFMTRNAFNTNPDASLYVQAPGVCMVNLLPGGSSGRLPVTTVRRVLPNQNRSLFSHAFNAYYLRWKENDALSLQLGNGARYFFTAALTGCMLIIGPGPTPTVTHVDGGHFNDNAMDRMCAVRSDGTNFGVQRYWSNGNFYASIVVGVREQAGWVFYAQNMNVNPGPPIQVVRV